MRQTSETFAVKDMDLTVQHITNEEGCKLKVYKDHLGYNTIGVGHLLDQEQSDEELEIIGSANVEKITQEQAEQLLKVDIQDAMLDMAHIFTEEEWNKIDATRQCVLISQIFQVGGAGLRKFRKMITAIKADDWEQAATESLDSLAARQTPQRWQRQADMLITGDNAEKSKPKQKELVPDEQLTMFSDEELIAELYRRKCL